MRPRVMTIQSIISETDHFKALTKLNTFLKSAQPRDGTQYCTSEAGKETLEALKNEFCQLMMYLFGVRVSPQHNQGTSCVMNAALTNRSLFDPLMKLLNPDGLLIKCISLIYQEDSTKFYDFPPSSIRKHSSGILEDTIGAAERQRLPFWRLGTWQLTANKKIQLNIIAFFFFSFLTYGRDYCAFFVEQKVKGRQRTSFSESAGELVIESFDFLNYFFSWKHAIPDRVRVEPLLDCQLYMELMKQYCGAFYFNTYYSIPISSNTMYTDEQIRKLEFGSTFVESFVECLLDTPSDSELQANGNLTTAMFRLHMIALLEPLVDCDVKLLKYGWVTHTDISTKQYRTFSTLVTLQRDIYSGLLHSFLHALKIANDKYQFLTLKPTIGLLIKVWTKYARGSDDLVGDAAWKKAITLRYEMYSVMLNEVLKLFRACGPRTQANYIVQQASVAEQIFKLYTCPEIRKVLKDFSDKLQNHYSSERQISHIVSNDLDELCRNQIFGVVRKDTPVQQIPRRMQLLVVFSSENAQWVKEICEFTNVFLKTYPDCHSYGYDNPQRISEALDMLCSMFNITKPEGRLPEAHCQYKPHSEGPERYPPLENEYIGRLTDKGRRELRTGEKVITIEDIVQMKLNDSSVDSSYITTSEIACLVRPLLELQFCLAQRGGLTFLRLRRVAARSAWGLALSVAFVVYLIVGAGTAVLVTIISLLAYSIDKRALIVWWRHRGAKGERHR